MRKNIVILAVALTCVVSTYAQDKAATNHADSPLSSQPSTTGPFGFHRGESKAEVIAQLGRGAIKKETPIILDVTTAPKPYPEFEEYDLLFSPTSGLLKIVAIGKDITDDSYGSEVRSRFSPLKAALIKTYGTPTSDFDFLKPESIWSDDKDFMMALTKKERNLDTYWLHLSNASQVTTIALSANGLTGSTGYLTLGYEFEGWDAYVDTVREKDNSVL